MRTVIVEDSPIDLEHLRILLEGVEDCEVVGEASNVDDAVKVVNREKPDLVFLDIHLVGENSFEKAVPAFEPDPLIICTTLDQEHALKAYDAGIVDYLLKPVSKVKLERAICRTTCRVTSVEKTSAKNILLKSGFKTKVIEPDSILLVKGERDYTMVTLSNTDRILSNLKMREWINVLPGMFDQLDRSTIVNLNKVKSFSKPTSARKGQIEFGGGIMADAGSTAIQRLEKALRS